MEIRYTKIGAERKGLVNSIAGILGRSASYQGAPTFAYRVGDFVISKDGAVSAEDGTGLSQLADALAACGYIGEADESEASEVIAEQTACNAAGVQMASGERVVVEYPAVEWSPENQRNLEKIVESKAALIEKVLGAESLPIERGGDVLRFPWFSSDAGTEAMAAYHLFVRALCETACNQKRVTAEPRAVENEKYTFRCFLLRLGFIGDEYKSARKILMAGLAGDGSFKKSKKDPSVADSDV